MKWMQIFLAGVAACAVAACDSTETTQSESPESPAAQVLPAELVLEEAPASARDVAAVRKEAAEGDEVVVRGVVAGRAEPIAANRAIFTLLDSSVQTCDKTEGDACPTPWDACCLPPEEIAANSLTVQVVDEQGNPLKTGLTGVDELAPMKAVTVVGTFHPAADGGSAIVNATGLAVE